jgi:charged multivesicular body protein 4
LLCDRDELREQNALSAEIQNAIANASIQEPIDEAELDAELEGMEQERIDEQMLNTGTVPVGDKIGRMPSVANGERESRPFFLILVQTRRPTAC